MNVEWKVLEEEGDGFKDEWEESPVRERPGAWRPWMMRLLVLLLLALLMGAGGLAWRVRQQTLRLREELSAVVEAEARMQAFGLEEEALTLVEPGAPHPWKSAYRALFAPAPEMPDWLLPGMNWQWTLPSVRPQVREVTLSGDRSYAEVLVVWQDRSELLEQRRYHLVEGRWLRTPRLGPDGQPTTPVSASGDPSTPPFPEEWSSYQTEHFVLRGWPADIEALTTDPTLMVDMEGFLAHFTAHWPAAFRLEEALTNVVIRPTEFAPVMLFPGSDGSIRINSPDFALTYPKSPLSSAAQLRVALCSQLAQRMAQIGWEETYRQGNLGAEAIEENFFMLPLLFFILPEFEAYEWALAPEERAALRATWRAELAGEWRSPFADPQKAFESNSEPRAFEPWVLSWLLLIDQLLAEGAIDSPGQLAQRLVAEPTRPFPDLLMELTGLEREALEEQLRDYALLQP